MKNPPGLTHVHKLQVTLSPTSHGDRTYMQIISEDGFTINIVLIADAIDVRDARAGPHQIPHDLLVGGVGAREKKTRRRPTKKKAKS